MTSFSKGDIVLVPFPYTDRNALYRRPSLLVSTRPLGGPVHPLAWVLMITSAENRKWPGDVLIEDLDGTGLLDHSFVRTAKVTNTELRGATRIGSLSPSMMSSVDHELRSFLGLYHNDIF